MQTHTYYTPKEAAAYLRLSTISLAMWRTRGIGPAYIKLDPTPTGRVVYRIRDLKALKAYRERAKAEQATKQKPRRIRHDGQVDQRRGHPSYANRIARGKRFEDLPAFADRAQIGMERTL